MKRTLCGATTLILSLALRTGYQRRRGVLKAAALLAAAGFQTTGFAEPVLHLHDSRGRLMTFDVGSNTIEIMGRMPDIMYDIAFDNAGRLFAVSHDATLWEIDPETADGAAIGSLGSDVGNVNALVFSRDGVLLAASNRLLEVNPATGAAREVGRLDGYRSAGDLAFDGNGNLYLSTTSNDLVLVDPATGAVTPIGPMGFSKVYALMLGSDGVMYGASHASEEVFIVDLRTGAGVQPVSYSEAEGVTGAFGGSFSDEAQPLAPTTRIEDLSPAPGAELTQTDTITVRFARPMTAAAVEDPANWELLVDLDADGCDTFDFERAVAVRGEVSYDACRRTAIFVPARPLPAGVYRFIFRDTLLDANGTALDGEYFVPGSDSEYPLVDDDGLTWGDGFAGGDFITLFRLTHNRLTVTIQGSGSVEPDGGLFPAGAEVVLTAEPAEGYMFERWEGTEAGDPMNLENTVLLDANREVVAIFTPVPTLDGGSLCPASSVALLSISLIGLARRPRAGCSA